MQTAALHSQLSWQNKTIEKALIAHKNGKIKQAYNSYHYVLRLNPNHPQALHYLGLMAQQNKHTQAAIKLISKSITLLPTDVRAYNHLAQVYLSLGNTAKAKIILEQGVKISPDHIDTLNSLANVLGDLNDLAGAILLYGKIIALNPKAAHSVFNLAQALKEVRRYQEALQGYLDVIAIEPNHLNAYHGAGITSEELGDFESAIYYYQCSLLNNPNQVRSVANLLAIKSFTPDMTLIAQAHKMLKSQQLNNEDSAKLHNGLGKYYDSQSQFDQAFQHFEKSCRSQKKTSGNYDINYGKEFCNNIIAAFDTPFFAQLKTLKRSNASPIFIVGMPRSGTTLVEQILASHSDVFGAGELTVIPKMSKQLLGDQHNQLTNLTTEVLVNAASQYKAAMKQAGHGKELMFSDKLPMNFMYLGLISAIFPNAKLIYCRRQPLDIGLSCYIEMFNLSSDFSIDLDDFSHYFLDHHRMMQHWKKVLPIEIFELKYEDLIANQEPVTRNLLRYVGLDWQNDCLSFHQTKRVVNTPSRWQVRQPIYTSSQQRWKNYQQHLTPLIDALQKADYCYE